LDEITLILQVVAIAPENDLLLIQSLQKYASADKEVSKKASDAIGRHLWYLSPMLAPLSFFNARLSVETKREMVEALRVNYPNFLPFLQ